MKTELERLIARGRSMPGYDLKNDAAIQLIKEAGKRKLAHMEAYLVCGSFSVAATSLTGGLVRRALVSSAFVRKFQATTVMGMLAALGWSPRMRPISSGKSLAKLASKSVRVATSLSPKRMKT